MNAPSPLDSNSIFQRMLEILHRHFSQKQIEAVMSERRLQSFDMLLNGFREHRSLRRGFYSDRLKKVFSL